VPDAGQSSVANPRAVLVVEGRVILFCTWHYPVPLIARIQPPYSRDRSAAARCHRWRLHPRRPGRREAACCHLRSSNLRSAQDLPSAIFGQICNLEIRSKSLILLVPGAGFEPATNGLQNRCSTTELTRLSLVVTRSCLCLQLSPFRHCAHFCAQPWRSSLIVFIFPIPSN